MVMKFGTIKGLANEHLFPEFSELWPTFLAANIFHSAYLTHFCHSATKNGRLRGLTNRHLFQNFVNFSLRFPRYHAAISISPSLCFCRHAFNEINEVWQQIFRKQVVRRGRNLAHC